MYLEYFSLKRHPFRITPDPSLFFPGGQDGRGVILNALIYAIKSGEGILKVVGEVGSGKTMLCRMLEEQLPEPVEIVYIANPSLSPREILYAIAIELKLDLSASTERLRVLHLIQDYLLEKHAQGGTVVVFIEEAQSMPIETLEEIRLLSNLETHQHKLMQIVLFGQPELDKNLAQKNIRQLKERITHSFSLMPLSSKSTSEYIRYRLKAAGCTRTGLFSSRAEKMIAKASSGLTRRINILADKALLAAYADSPSRQPSSDSNEALVLPRHVKAAIKDSGYKNNFESPWLLGAVGLTGVFILVVFVGLRYFWVGMNDADVPDIANVSLQNDQGIQTLSPIVEDTSNINALVQIEDETQGEADEADETDVAAETIAGANQSVPDNSVGIIVRESINPESNSEPAAGANEVSESAQVSAITDTLDTLIVERNNSESEQLALAEQQALNDEPGLSEQEISQVDTELQQSVQVDSELSATLSNTDTENISSAEQTVEVSEIASIPISDNSVATNSASLADQAEVADTVQTDSASTSGLDREELPVVVVREEPSPVENSLPESPVAIVPSGLAALRIQPTADWLRSLEDQSGYSLVLFSVPSTNPNGLEEYLQFLQLLSLLDETYICFRSISSETSGRWQVMHKVFQGVTPARNYIDNLPVYIQRYNPFVSNLDRIECSYPVEINN